MIRHIVFFSVKRSEDLPAIQAGLQMLGRIPQSSLFEVAVNTKVDQLSDAVDIVVYAEFKDADALAAYKADKLYQEATSLVRPLRDLRISADILASS